MQAEALNGLRFSLDHLAAKVLFLLFFVSNISVSRLVGQLPAALADVGFTLTASLLMMVRSPLSILKGSVGKRRTIIVGLKYGNYSREMLLRLLKLVVVPGDNVLAVHVQESNDGFDPNSFHIHEDLCKSKQVDFQVRVCTGSSYIVELSQQVRMYFATILAVGCSSPWPKDSTVTKCLKALPPTCSLLVMDDGGKILMQRQGTSQQGSVTRVLQSSVLSVSEFDSHDQSEARCHLQKSLTMPCSSTLSPPQQSGSKKLQSIRKNLSFPDVTQKLFGRLATLEVKGSSRRFTLEQLKCATNNFSPEMLIEEGGHSEVYRATLDDGQAAAVKVINSGSQHSEEDLFQEVEILSSLKHDNIVQLLAYCYCKDMQAVVYNTPRESEAKTSTAEVGNSALPNSESITEFSKPINVVGTFGYLAPEYMMFGKVDEKIDVYSYGVVLLEFITGKEAIPAKSIPDQESLVLWILSVFVESDHWLEMQRKRELLNAKGETEFCSRHEESGFSETLLVDDG
ncbi:hypothetical protein ACH5RR_021858 [Cinchona calisaya]|uniref:Protein kinase domain-containing protein n=1 Tax=Cinchona calisaya TaxID=153742 RepID=A0ABD2Z662_9GENT